MDSPGQPRVNVADRLAEAARERPNATALVNMGGPTRQNGEFVRRTVAPGCSPMFDVASFDYIDTQADDIARGLAAMGVGPGKRIALLVKPGIEFVTLVFALLRTGATMVLVDAGLGRKNIVRCLASTEPDGFVAIPIGHALRVLKRKQFAKAKLNVTVGRRWFWGGETLGSLMRLGESAIRNPQSAIRNPPSAIAHTTASDPAAIVFTSGSTGPPKGVLYTHETFVTQCAMIQAEYDIRPGDIDLACFPLFGLFNIACGVTTVLPDMDFSRPASCDPKKILAAANQWQVTQAFASPAVWDRLSRYCESTGERIPTLRKILSCGAPVPAKVLRRTLACVHPDAEMHTPYGATEALPIATIEAKEILGETAAKTDEGAGVCVGKKFGTRDGGRGTGEDAESSDGEPPTLVGGGNFDWRVIRISDAPITTIEETEELPTGEIGELIVRGPQVSTRYLSGEPGASATGVNPHNPNAKITDGATVWHRMGDVGYFDAEGRFWYCGRKSQRVVTASEPLFTECIEHFFNRVRGINKTALVAVPDGESTQAALVIECDGTEGWEDIQNDLWTLEHLWMDLADCRGVQFLEYEGPLPTDIRHNSKIRREELAVWAAKELQKRRGTLINANQH